MKTSENLLKLAFTTVFANVVIMIHGSPSLGQSGVCAHAIGGAPLPCITSGPNFNGVTQPSAPSRSAATTPFGGSIVVPGNAFGTGNDAPPSRRNEIIGSEARQRDQLSGMNFGNDQNSSSSISGRVSSAEQAVADIISDVNVAKDVAKIINDPKEWATDRLRSSVRDISDKIVQNGIALITDRTFCSNGTVSPECSGISQIAAQIIDTTPEFGGIRDRIQKLRGGLTGYVQDKLDALSSQLTDFKSAP